MAKRKVRLMLVSGPQDEQAATKTGRCEFAIVDRSDIIPSQPEQYLFFVTTSENDNLTRLNGWKLLLPGSIEQPSRYGLSVNSKDVIKEQLATYYGSETEVDWVTA